MNFVFAIPSLSPIALAPKCGEASTLECGIAMYRDALASLVHGLLQGPDHIFY